MRSLVPVALLALAGCGGPPDAPIVTGHASEKAKELSAKLSAAQDEFAFKLKDELVSRDETRNIAFSPISISRCLSLLLNGAAGSSETLLKRTLGYASIDLNAINSGNLAQMSDIKGGELKSANSIWISGSFAPEPSFTDVLKRFYYADYHNAGSFGPEITREIDRWASDHTDGLIPSLGQQFGPDYQVLALNAVLFRAKWQKEFDRMETQPESFTRPNGEKPLRRLMHEYSMSEYCEGNDGSKMLRKNYRGERFAFMGILPPHGQAASEFLRVLTPKRFRDMEKSLREKAVAIALPRFEIASRYDLNPAMKKLGLTPLYKSIDLSKISLRLKDSAPLTQVLQKCYIKVDEEGTKAAALSEGAAGGIGRSTGPEFKADRPFIFVVEDVDLKTILFMGLVNDPAP